MQKNILAILTKNDVNQKILTHLETSKDKGYLLQKAYSVAEAENLLFEMDINLIIADVELDGTIDFIKALKADEMFSFLPVLMILPHDSMDLLKKVFTLGVENYFTRTHDPALLTYIIQPLIKNNLFNAQTVKKVSHLQEQAIQDFILLDLIKKYIPKTILDIAQIFAREQKISIPEEEMNITVVFADLKDFTRISQHLTPIEVIKNLNSVFEIVTRIVYTQNGDVDKFIGDAFLGVFSESRAAVKAMLLIQQEIEQLNLQRQKIKQPPLLFRMGIHTGPVIRGNVGGNQRFDNTLIGDTVNTASRLESVAPPGGILVSEATRAQAGLTIPGQYLSQVQLRGHDKVMIVYSIYEYLKGKIDSL